MSTTDIFEKFHQIIIQYIQSIEQWDRNVGPILLPNKLKKIFDFSLKTSNKDIQNILHDILKYSPATQSKFFFNQLYAWADPIWIIGDWLATILNTSMATYEVSPVFSLMEKEVIETFAEKIWRKEGEYQWLLLPGGSLSNQYAIHCARSKFNPDWLIDWYQSTQILDIFISDQAHYSFMKWMMFMWLWKKQCISIETDTTWAMIENDLEKKIQLSMQNNHIPLMVVATSGTTVLWAFDNISNLSQICKKYGIWLHVDAARGWAVLLSKVHNNLLHWINSADSIVINAHKMLRSPQQTSLFFVQDNQLLHTSNSLNADYLFHHDEYATHNTWDDYIQCARKVDSLKLWLMIKYHSLNQMWERVDIAISNARYMYSELSKNSNFIVYSSQSYSNVCFWLLPKNSKNTITRIDDLLMHDTEINKFTIAVKYKMLQWWNMMINYQPIKWYPNAFRMIFINPSITFKDIDNIIKQLETLAQTIDIDNKEINLELEKSFYE